MRSDEMNHKKNVMETDAENKGKTEHKFSKEQLLASERFRDQRDIVAALLDDGTLYTVRSVEEKIEKYMKGKVR